MNTYQRKYAMLYNSGLNTFYFPYLAIAIYFTALPLIDDQTGYRFPFVFAEYTIMNISKSPTLLSHTSRIVICKSKLYNFKQRILISPQNGRTVQYARCFIRSAMDENRTIHYRSWNSLHTIEAKPQIEFEKSEFSKEYQ